MPKWMSYDYGCECGNKDENVTVMDKDEEIFCRYCDLKMHRLPVGGPKNYTWGAGDNSASTVPKKFRREGQ